MVAVGVLRWLLRNGGPSTNIRNVGVMDFPLETIDRFDAVTVAWVHSGSRNVS